MVKILMHGCNGKMGRMITEIVKNEEDAVIAAGVDKFTGIPNDYPVFEEIAQCDVDVDVVIDFSNAGAVDELLDYCVKKSLPVVLCTTGLSDEQLKKVDECSEKIAVLKSANMSMGINLLLKLLKDAAKVLAPAGYDIELVEKHHNQKLDAPSGTAAMLVEAMDPHHEFKRVYGREGFVGKRGKEIGIHAIRGGTVAGEHTVLYLGEDESLKITHTASSRMIFVNGAWKALDFMAKRPNGYYTMKDLTGEEQ